MFRQRLCVALAIALLLPAGAAGAERMTDEQVKRLIEDIDTGYDTWKKDLDKANLDDAVITSAERTVKVKTFLEDFEKAIDTVKDRFKPAYAATPEVLALLRLGSDVELRHRRQGDTPRSTWPPLGAKLESLARAYGLGWPIESMNVQPARLNDDELAGRIEQMEKSAKALRREAEQAAKANKTIDKASRESLKVSIQQLESTAKEVRARVEDDRPAAVEVGQLFSQATSVKDTLTRLSIFSAGGAWRGIDTGLEVLARACALRRP
jgi:hypothetical protein